MKFLPVDVSHCCSKGSITFIIFFPFGYIFSYWILQISVQLLFWKLRDKHCIKSCQLHTPEEFSIASLETWVLLKPYLVDTLQCFDLGSIEPLAKSSYSTFTGQCLKLQFLSLRVLFKLCQYMLHNTFLWRKYFFFYLTSKCILWE